MGHVEKDWRGKKMLSTAEKCAGKLQHNPALQQGFAAAAAKSRAQHAVTFPAPRLWGRAAAAWPAIRVANVRGDGGRGAG
ncbi:MAG TPA: hypothetical protein VF541_09990 [Longimicrobium sp.]|jgi:hypothetical protein